MSKPVLATAMRFAQSILYPLLVVVLCSATPALAGDPTEEVLEAFRFISRFDRRSKHEAAVRDGVIGLVQQYQPGWQHKVVHKTDRAGNLLIVLPGTGRYQSAQPVALQAHLDMVGAVRGVPAGTDLSPYFKNGVVLEQQGDWLQSKDRLTTLGADNGIGVAIALRYLMHPEIEHPPLELVFTVDEEEDFTGVNGLDFPLSATVMVNLDGEDAGAFWVGCMGAVTAHLTLFFGADNCPNTGRLVTVELGNLAGGHSGLAGHLVRMNGLMEGARYSKTVLQSIPGSALLRLQSGQASNVIPSGFNALFRVPEGVSNADLAGLLERQIRAALPNYPDERPWEELQVKARDEENEVRNRAVENASLLKLFDLLESYPQGVLSRNPQYLNSIQGTQSVGVLDLRYDASKFVKVRIEALGRSFDAGELESLAQQNGALAQSFQAPWLVYSEHKEGITPAWVLTDPALIAIAKKVAPSHRLYAIPGTLEAGVVQSRYPQMRIISLGPDVRNVHSSDEVLFIPSLAPAVGILEALLGEVAAAKKPPPSCDQALLKPEI